MPAAAGADGTKVATVSWLQTAQARGLEAAAGLAELGTRRLEDSRHPLALIAGMAVGIGAFLGGLISLVILGYQGNRSDRIPPRSASRTPTAGGGTPTGRLLVASNLPFGRVSRAVSETDGEGSVCATASNRSEVHMAWSTSVAEFQGLSKAQTAELLKIAHRAPPR